MKSLFKIVFFYSLTTQLMAREIILIENQATPQEGQLLLKILQEKFNIPRKLITYKSINNKCASNSEAIMQLCLKKDGDLEIVKLNKYVVENSLRVFIETEE